MLFFKKIWVCPLLFIVLTGCRKPTSANWDVDVILPVVNSSLNIKHFIGDSIFTADNTGLLSLTINREVASLKLDSLFSLPDTTIIPQPFYAPFALPLQPGQSIPFLPSTELKFDIGGGVELKHVDVRQCIMSVKFSNNVPQPLDLIYCIPNATKYGLPFTITETVPTGTNSLVKDYDLSGYSMNMRGLSGNVYNTIVQTYTVMLSASASNSVVVNSNQGVAIAINYSEVIPEYVEGYFGKQVIDIPSDTVEIGLTKNFKASNFMLSDATMNFNIINEFGAEFSANLSGIRAINTQQLSSELLSSPQFNAININPATKQGTTVSPSVKPILLNSHNSNITTFISQLPDRLSYQGKVSLNPNTDYSISGHNDFAFYNTGIHIKADISIPMRFTADYFQLRSSTPVDFSNVKQLDKVNSGNFVISSSNGFPFDATLQAYLIDGNGKILDSLFSNTANTIARGQINSLNIVTFPTRSRLLVPITKNKIDALRKSTSIRVVSYFLLPKNPPEIGLYENYQLDVNIIAEVNYNVGLEN